MSFVHLFLGLYLALAAWAVPATRARVASELHAAIQDAFNRHGVQIMSPHYFRDPDTPKLVAEGDWYAPPAVPEKSR